MSCSSDARRRRRGWEWRYLDQLCRRELSSVQGPDDRLSTVASIRVEDKRIVSGGTGFTVRFWDSTTGKVTHELGDKFRPLWLEVSPDGKLLVSVGWIPNTSTSTAKLWDAATGTQIQELRRYNPGGSDGAATFSPDGRWLAVAMVSSRSRTPAAVTLWT